MAGRRLAATVALVCVVVAGCASKSATKDTGPASKAQLKKVVLRSTDLPRGWKGTRDVSTATEQDKAFDAILAKCMHVRTVTTPTVAEATSADFQYKQALISSWAASYRLQRYVNSDTKLVQSPKFTPCFQRALAQQRSPGESMTVKFTAGSGGGPDNVIGSGRATLKFTESGKRYTVYMRVVFITGPLLEAEVTGIGVGKPFPESVLKRAVEAVAGRAAKV